MTTPPLPARERSRPPLRESSDPSRASVDAFDEADAYLCACEGLPYTQAEWEREVIQLEHALRDAKARNQRALRDGVCLPEKFDRRCGEPLFSQCRACGQTNVVNTPHRQPDLSYCWSRDWARP